MWILVIPASVKENHVWHVTISNAKHARYLMVLLSISPAAKVGEQKGIDYLHIDVGYVDTTVECSVQLMPGWKKLAAKFYMSDFAE